MARQFTSASSQYGATAAAVAHGIGTGDFTVMLKILPNALDNAQEQLYANGSSQLPIIYLRNFGVGSIELRYAGGIGVNCGTSIALGSRYSIALRRLSGTVSLWVDGSSVGSGSDSTSFSDERQVVASDNAAAASAVPNDCEISEVALWTAALDSAEIAAYHNGFSPLLLRRASLKWYCPMNHGTTTEPDLVRGQGLVMSGSPAKATHPRMFYPRRKQVWVPAAAAPGGFSTSRHRANAGLGALGGGSHARANAGLGAIA